MYTVLAASKSTWHLTGRSRFPSLVDCTDKIISLFLDKHDELQMYIFRLESWRKRSVSKSQSVTPISKRRLSDISVTVEGCFRCWWISNREDFFLWLTFSNFSYISPSSSIEKAKSRLIECISNDRNTRAPSYSLNVCFIASHQSVINEKLVFWAA